MTSRQIYAFFTAWAAMSMIGCATLRMYSGPSLPKNQVAFLERGDGNQSLVYFDDRGGGNFFLVNRVLEILPGKHTVVIAYRGLRIRSTARVTLTFIAEPGKRYVIKSNVSDFEWFPEIIEK